MKTMFQHVIIEIYARLLLLQHLVEDHRLHYLETLLCFEEEIYPCIAYQEDIPVEPGE